MDYEEEFERYKAFWMTAFRELLGWSEAEIAEAISEVEDKIDSLLEDRSNALFWLLHEGPLQTLVDRLVPNQLRQSLTWNELTPIWNRVYAAIEETKLPT